MLGLIDIIPKIVQGLPHRHVEQNPIIVERPQISGVIFFSVFVQEVTDGVNADLKLTHFRSERRFKSDTPPLLLPAAYEAGAVSRLAFTIPAAR